MTLRAAILAVLTGMAVLGARAGPLDGFADFSRAGYGGGGRELPAVPGRYEVAPGPGLDDTPALQAAIDAVAKLAPDESGFRGAVVLRPGAYRVKGPLRIAASGIVLRGHDATLVATGHSRRTLIEVSGAADRLLGPAFAVTDDVVPVDRTRLTLSSVEGLSVGTRVVVRRPSTKEWIHALGMDQFTGTFHELRLDWAPGSRDLEWERTLTAVDAATRTVTLDLPLTTALEARFGGGTVQTFTWPGRIHQVGIEGLTCTSEFDAAHSGDEEHSWMCLSLDNVEDAWVRNVTARHFVSAAVWVGPGAKSVTVEDCHMEQPTAENAGWRRLGFYVGGQQVLVLRCTADGAREAFAISHGAAGPNVFLECTAARALANSGAIESWASGALFDNVGIEGAGLALANLGQGNQGAGWSAAHCVLWNCSGAVLKTEDPPGASNRVVTSPEVKSLYRVQLALRGGVETAVALAILPLAADAQLLGHADPPPPRPLPVPRTLAIVNGRFTADGRALFGGAMSNAWWKGQLIPALAAGLGVSPTRWAPGRTGPGLTEDLEALGDRMIAQGTPFFEAWPGLWYDRRRDEHSTTMRGDADAWGPFYEQPWARSGEGRAADGLSRYDLGKFNPWYFDRLRTFADLCAVRGLVLVHHFYNNHNTEETGAHWSDFPWRPANALQDTGFPEPPPYDGKAGNTIHVADRFYDVTDSERRSLHRLYIFHALNAFLGTPNVIHTLGFQFAGPLGFQQFFLDTVGEWENASRRRVHVALETSKAVTDAILADPERAALVDVIDMRYWQYLADGTLFAPDGQGRLAFRELRTAAFGKDAVPDSTPELVYRQVREYHDRYPDKAIVCGHAGTGAIPILMAGGAAPLLGDLAAAQPFKPERDDRAFIAFVNDRLGSALPRMNPNDDIAADGTWCLMDDGRTYLFYSLRNDGIRLVRPLSVRTAEAVWFNPRTGSTQRADLGDGQSIAKPTAEAWLLLVKYGKG